MAAKKIQPTVTVKQVKAAILGHAVGDALGVPVEFATREELDECPITGMEGFGSYPFPAGSWSDDTSMTLAAMDSIAETGRVDYDSVMLHFGQWYYRDKYTPTGKMFDVGNTCSIAIDNYFAYYADAGHCGINREDGNGNGSLMRILPFALYGYLHPEQSRETVKRGSALTHAHPRSMLACLLYAELLHALLRKPSKEAVAEALAECEFRFGGEEEWRHFTRLWAIATLPREEIRSSGYVVDTLEAALWCLMTTESYRECLLAAVNLGDDTDTVAAVAGGLAGVLYGLDAIPPEWLEALRKRRFIESLCERFFLALTASTDGENETDEKKG